MPKRCAAGLCALLLLVGLCACTHQRDTDPAEFCRRYNAQAGDFPLVYEEFFKETAGRAGDYLCDFSFAEGHKALLTLAADDAGAVQSLQLTCIPAGEAAYTRETFAALFACFVRLCGVLAVAESEQAAADLVHQAGLTADRLHFADDGYQSAANGYRFSLFSGEAYLSLFCVRTR